MTWFKVDDKFYSHRKVRALSKGAIALWVRAGAYCADHLTDGEVTWSDISWLEGEADEVNELVNAGLWIETELGWAFHDWHTYQPSKAKVEERRERERERIATARAKAKKDTSLITRPVPSVVADGSQQRCTQQGEDNGADPLLVGALVAQMREEIKR